MRTNEQESRQLALDLLASGAARIEEGVHMREFVFQHIRYVCPPAGGSWEILISIIGWTKASDAVKRAAKLNS